MKLEDEIARSLYDRCRRSSGHPPSLASIKQLAASEAEVVLLHQRSDSHRHRVAVTIISAAALVGLLILVGTFNRNANTVSTTANRSANASLYGAVLPGSPLDVSDGPERIRPHGQVQVFSHAATRRSLALFSDAPRGGSSVDKLAAQYEPVALRATPAEMAEPTPDTNGLRLIRWGPAESQTVLGFRGFSADDAIRIAEALDDGSTLDEVAAADMRLTYNGPDVNPFAGGSGIGPTLAYDRADGGITTIHYAVDAAPPTAYRWYLTDFRVIEVDGRDVTLVDGNDGVLAAWQEGGDVIIISAPEEAVQRAIAEADVVDQATWEATADKATDLSSHFKAGSIDGN